MSRLAEDSRTYAKDQIKNALDYLKSAQAGPPGTIPRSTRERNALWKKLVSLEKPELQAIMEAMAQRAGHTPDEDRPCELCRFLMEHMEMDKK